MVKAYVLINAESGKEDEIVSLMRKMPQFSEVDLIFGPNDIIGKIDAKNVNEVGNVMLELRKKTGGIEKSSTMIAKEDYADAMRK